MTIELVNNNEQDGSFRGNLFQNVVNRESIISRGAVILMEDLSKLRIAQHNSLIESVAKMNALPLKFFELAVSCIDTTKPPEDNTVYFSKELAFSVLGFENRNKHNDLNDVVDSFGEKAFFKIVTLGKEKNDIEFRKIYAIEETRFSTSDDIVYVKFTGSIMPYLIDFKEKNFTQYLLSDIAKLQGKHSITIYKWLSMHFNQFTYYQYSSKRNRKQKESYKNPQIYVKELRTITDTENEYKRFYDFERWVLKESIQEINENTHLNVTYEKIKSGREVIKIQFFITEKPIKKAVPLDEEYLESRLTKEERMQELDRLWSKSIDHKYTKMLSEGKYRILSTSDVINKDKMANLLEFVYPDMEELESLDKQGVKRVLNRILKYIPEVDEDKLIPYLKTAFSNEITKVKIYKAGDSKNE